MLETFTGWHCVSCGIQFQASNHSGRSNILSQTQSSYYTDTSCIVYKEMTESGMQRSFFHESLFWFPGEFPAQRPVTRSFDVFFDLRPNKRLSKQWWGWWFETPPCPLWRHRNGETVPAWPEDIIHGPWDPFTDDCETIIQSYKATNNVYVNNNDDPIKSQFCTCHHS